MSNSKRRFEVGRARYVFGGLKHINSVETRYKSFIDGRLIHYEARSLY